MSPRDLYKQLGVAEKTLTHWRTGPPFVRFGGRPFYVRDSLAKWLGAPERQQEKSARRHSGY